MKSHLFAAALLGTLALGTASHATPIAYQFSTPNQGINTTSGTFVFDAATNQESDVSITIVGDSVAARNGVYTQVGPSTPPATTPFPFGTSAADIIVGTSGSGAEAWIGFSAPLTPAGGLIVIMGLFVDNTDFGEFRVLPPFGLGFGSATPVAAAPEPASLAVLTVGLLGLVAGRRSRRQSGTT